MCDNINIYTLEDIKYNKSTKDFDLFQNKFVISPGDGVKFIPTRDGCEISRTEYVGKHVTRRYVETSGVIYPSGDTTIEAISLNKNSINKIFIQLGIRDSTNNLCSWSNITAYFQYFNTTVTQMGTTQIETVGTLNPSISITTDNFQIILFVTGLGVLTQTKSSTVLETMQFSG